MGLALVLQTVTGLRPSELLQLQPSHLLFPRLYGESLSGRPLVLALGVKEGTNLGAREESKGRRARECRGEAPQAETEKEEKEDPCGCRVEKTTA